MCNIKPQNLDRVNASLSQRRVEENHMEEKRTKKDTTEVRQLIDSIIADKKTWRMPEMKEFSPNMTLGAKGPTIPTEMKTLMSISSYDPS